MMILSHAVMGQKVSDTPPYFMNSVHTIISQNPAASTDTSRIELGSFYHYFTGGFSKIRSFHFYSIIRNKHKNGFSFDFNSDQQGPIFQKNRFYGGYIQRIPLTRDIYSQLAVKVGLVNYFFKASQGGIGGSDIAFDGHVGGSLFGKSWLVGATWHQFAPDQLQPIAQVFLLRHYWELIGKKTVDITSIFSMTSYWRSRISSPMSIHQFTLEVNAFDVFTGIGVSNEGLNLQAGYEGFLFSRKKQNRFHLSLLYFSPINRQNNSIGFQKFEIVLKAYRK